MMGVIIVLTLFVSLWGADDVAVIIVLKLLVADWLPGVVVVLTLFVVDWWQDVMIALTLFLVTDDSNNLYIIPNMFALALW